MGSVYAYFKSLVVMDLDLFILVICSLAILSIGAVIFVRNPSQSNNRRFALISIAIIAWTLFNYLSDHSTTNNLLFTRLTFVAGALAISSVLNFIANFPIKGVLQNSVFLKINKLFTFFLIPIIFLPGFIQSVSGSVEEGYINTSYLYPIYILYILYSLLLLLVIIQRQSQGAVTLTQKQQSLLLSTGIAIYAILAIFSNIALPLLIDNWSSSRFGPLFSLLFVGVIAYSIIKHGLFDIRAVVARSIAYLMSLGIVALAISSLIFVLSQAVEDTKISENIQTLVFITSTLLLVLSYPALKKFFDRVTNSIFYRDAYDAEQFIGRLNQVVVSDIQIYSLLRKVVSVIEDNLKVTYCAFATVNHSGAVVLVSDDPNESQSLTKLNIKLLKSINEHRPLVVTDYLDEQKDSRLKNHLLETSLGAVVSLVSKRSNEPQQFSKVYMVLGLKKSGNPFTSQDVRVLRIISNSLALAIQNALRFEEISRFNITLQEKIDEATRNLRKANIKLKALDETKDEFISMASHQLRTPLTSVKGYLSMVLEGDTGPLKADQRKLLQQAFDSSQRMVFLIADLLNVSRLKTGKFVIENKPTNLAELVEAEVNQLKETAAARGLQLHYRKPSDFPLLMLDETKIRQVVMNFLDNAIYYTPSGGEITATIKSTALSVEYTVTDTGLGVPKRDQHHLFSKFYRAGNAKRMRPDGTGLGLFMAKKVIVAQGGAIIFSSTEGRGSTFGFRFPRQGHEVQRPK